jgi:hypothetical protein
MAVQRVAFAQSATDAFGTRSAATTIANKVNFRPQEQMTMKDPTIIQAHDHYSGSWHEKRETHL